VTANSIASAPFGVNLLYWFRTGDATCFCHLIDNLMSSRGAQPRGDLSLLHCHSEGALPPKGDPKNLGGGRKCGDCHASLAMTFTHVSSRGAERRGDLIN